MEIYGILYISPSLEIHCSAFLLWSYCSAQWTKVPRIWRLHFFKNIWKDSNKLKVEEIKEQYNFFYLLVWWSLFHSNAFSNYLHVAYYYIVHVGLLCCFVVQKCIICMFLFISNKHCTIVLYMYMAFLLNQGCWWGSDRLWSVSLHPGISGQNETLTANT